jgi:hypothetical protein
MLAWSEREKPLAAAHLPRAPRREEIHARPDRGPEDPRAARAAAVRRGAEAAQEGRHQRCRRTTTVKRPSGNRGGSNGAAPAKKAETPESKAKRELEERIAAEVEERYAERLFTAVRANYPKALGRAGLQRVAARLFQQAEWTELTLKAWKWSSARWMSYDDALKKAAPLTEPQLERLILDLMLEDALCAGDEAAEAKRYKVDAAKVRETIEREVRQKLDPKSAQPAPAKKAGKTAKKKSR